MFRARLSFSFLGHTAPVYAADKYSPEESEQLNCMDRGDPKVGKVNVVDHYVHRDF